MQTVAQKLSAVELRLRRWQTRLTRATNMVTKLDRQRRRLQAQMGPVGLTELIGPPKAKPMPKAEERPAWHYPDKAKPIEPPKVEAIETDHVAEVELPDFLDRRNAVIAEEMTAKRKAAEAEARRQMPLTGRSALEAIKPKRKSKK